MLSFSYETHWQTAAQALLSSRPFPSIRLLGLIEDCLAVGMDAVLKDVLAHLGIDAQDGMVRFLTPIYQRLVLMTKDI